MRFTALKPILAAVVITTAALSAYTAKAEARLKVPFSFTVSGHTMPAGAYTVQEDTLHNAVIFRSNDGSKSFAYVLRPGGPTLNVARVVLKFSSSGDVHILRSIQFGSGITSPLDSAPARTSYEPARLSQGR